MEQLAPLYVSMALAACRSGSWAHHRHSHSQWRNLRLEVPRVTMGCQVKRKSSFRISYMHTCKHYQSLPISVPQSHFRQLRSC